MYVHEYKVNFTRSSTKSSDQHGDLRQTYLWHISPSLPMLHPDLLFLNSVIVQNLKRAVYTNQIMCYSTHTSPNQPDAGIVPT